ncbi:hypothetical protein CONPUDRAFT_169315 [Coniophora puteana RWD-64-598 SS2]|uniref:Uncharacterized protein n=1 Tax=Coniophora puteana (strain RWD-64-598) TaxID=741705 RepID=A0A5M3M9D7_CONPW|nr:uncharacterized protein CONPUDRAFT_169315 [Coniophora puteana RWD-64-598 SS2]EIW75474.1 hypothetical protein CONPUDRAFT_169315 [Coniophora puteana RWD-64-598 SS2]
MDVDINDRPLSEHVYRILAPYAKEYITVDHVAVTEETAELLLSMRLDYIPLHEPDSLILPEDPLVLYIRNFKSQNIAPYSERWVASEASLKLLKKTFVPPEEKKLPSERCWDEDDHYERWAAICRPESPVLTTRARRETPRLPSDVHKSTTPQYLSEIPQSIIGLVGFPEDDEDLAFSVTRDEVLDLRLQLDHHQHSGVVSLLKSIPALCPPPKGGHQNRHVEAFLRSDSPIPAILRLDSPPLFPRATERSTDSKNTTHIPNISGVLPLIARAEDVHMSSPHLEVDCMGILEGESTFSISSPPSFTLRDSGSDLDLASFGASDPHTPDTSMALMDEIEIPRTQKLGSGVSSVRITDGETFESFVSKHVHRPVMPIPIRPQPALDTSKSTHKPPSFPLVRSPARTQLDSMLGQPSEPKSEDEEKGVREDSEGLSDDLDRALERIYRGTKRKERYFIVEETLDEKDTGLMEVPNLPPPNASRPSSAFALPNLRQLLAPSKKARKFHPHGSLPPSTPADSLPPVLRGHMKPVTGVKPLNIELSWVPFKYGAKVPTHEELSRVDDTIVTDVNASTGSPKTLEALMERGFVEDAEGGGGSAKELRGSGDLGLSPPHVSFEHHEEDGFELALTKRERLGPRSEHAEFDGVDQGSHSPEPVASLPPSVPREDPPHILHSPSQNQPTPNVPVSDVGLWHSSAGDSGIDLVLDCDAASMGEQVSWDDYYAHYQEQQLHNSWGGAGGHVRHPMRDADTTGYSNMAPVQYPDSDKENTPPLRVEPSHEPLQMRYQGDVDDSLASGMDMEAFSANGDDLLGSSLAPASLSFPSQGLPRLGGGSDADIAMDDQSDHPGHPGESQSYSQADARRSKPLLAETMVLPTTKGSLEAFLTLRRKPFLAPPSSPPPTEAAPVRAEPLELPAPDIQPSNRPPNKLINPQTLVLPPDWVPQLHIHRYLASLTFIQNHGLLRVLSGDAHVDLVSRDYLNDVDIIVDPEAGVIFVSLRSLAAQPELERVAKTLCVVSWRFSALLVVLHAYNSSAALNANRSRAPNAVNAYTTPVVKAVARLRRIMGLSEGAGDRDGRCVLTWAFAENVREAAFSVRHFAEGMEAEAMNSQKQRAVLWGDRPWMDADEQDGEADMAHADGMNVFAAFVMLLQDPFDTIVSMSSEERTQEFSDLVGADRVRLLNANIERERAAAENQELPNSDGGASSMFDYA